MNLRSHARRHLACAMAVLLAIALSTAHPDEVRAVNAMNTVNTTDPASAPRVLRKEITIQAPIERVWHAWTTEAGLAPVAGACRVELRVGGPYEWFLAGEPDENGRRGSEGCQVLAFLPHEVFAFDWNFPPAVPALRASGVKTQVVVQFDELPDGSVRVRFAQHGWGQGEDHDRGYEYFDQAWTWVLETMKKSLERA